MASYMPVTSRPIQNTSGLVTGYDRDYLNPLLPKQPERVGINSQGIYINLKNGLPFTGEIPNAVMGGASIGFANNGQLVPNPATPTTTGTAGVVADPFKPTLTNVVKQPEIAAANAGLLTKQNNLSNALNKSFDDYLAEFKTIAAENKIQLGKDRAAFDTSNIERELPAADRSYETAQRDISTGIGQTNTDYAKATAERLARLDAENRRFETDSRAVADQAFALESQRNKAHALTTGTPQSNSGDLSNRYINAYARINVPLQAQLSDRRYNQINNIEGAATRELYGNDLAFAASKSALESDVSNRRIQTMKYLQGLVFAVAGKSREMAAEYLRQRGVPEQLGLAILSGEISNLINSQVVDTNANNYGLMQEYDASREAGIVTPNIRSPDRNYVPQPPYAEPRITGRIGTVTGNQFPTGASSRPTTSRYYDQTPVYSPRETISQEDMWPFDYTPPPVDYNRQWQQDYLP